MPVAEKHHPDWKGSDVRRFPSLGGVTAVAIMILVVIGFYWKLVLTNQFTWLAGPDTARQVLPWFEFQASEWHAGRFPLWDPYSWGGQPLLAQGQPGAAYPLNWLLFLAPLKHSWIRQSALHWYFVLIRVLAALALYAFCRDMGCSRRASSLAGILYATSAFVGSVDWPQMVNGVVWAPLVLLFQFRIAGGRQVWRSAVLSGFSAGALWLCGHHQVPIFVWLTWVCVWLYLILREKLNALIPILALAIGVLVSAFQTIPMAEYARLARRYAGSADALRWNEAVPYSVHEQYSFKPLSILGIVIPGIDFNISAFIGVVGFTFAVIGLGWRWQDVRVRLLGGIALGAILFSLGPNSVLHGILYAIVPMVEKARVPAQGILLFQIAACGLFAFGVDALEFVSSSGAKRIAGVLIGAAAVISAGGLFLYLAHQLQVSADNRFMIAALAAAATGGAAYGFSRGAVSAPTAVILLALMMLVECGNVTGYYLPHQDDRERTADLRRMAEDGDIIAFLRNEPGRFRIDHDGEAIPHNFGQWWGIESYAEYVASLPDRIYAHDAFSARTEALFGIRYFIGTKPQREDDVLIFHGASGRNVYARAGAFPRAWTVHEVWGVKPGETIERLRDPAFNPHVEAFVTGAAPQLESCASDDAVEVVRHLPNEVTLQADMKCRGMAILGDAWFPGWRATVDGRPATIYDADALLRGVVVERGRHVIEFRYRPTSVLAGAAMSLAGAVTAALFWAAPRLRAAAALCQPLR
jgi:hypothetical protein